MYWAPYRLVKRMTVEQILWALFGALIIGLMLPFSYAVRMGLFLLLIGLAVATFLGGGMQHVIHLMD